MVKIVYYAVADIHGGFTRYSSLQGVIDALERDGLTLDDPKVKIYATKVGCLIVDCY